MSVEVALQRIAMLQQARTDPAALLAAARAGGGAAPAPGSETAAAAATAPGGSFASILESETSRASTSGSGSSPASSALLEPGASGSSSASAAAYSALGLSGTSGLSGVAGAGSLSGLGSQNTGQRIVAIAESQLGQAEQPPGSNEGPAIATYRTATAGAMPGAPWCAYFASWVARQAGTPLGASGEGLGGVSEIWSWAQSAGRAISNGPGVEPQPGDLIVFGGEHVGIVKEVMPNGDIRTVEGNYENKVAENVRTPTEATGYVDMQ